MPDTNSGSIVPALLERCDFPAAGSHVICAVSGGPDSLALLALAAAAGLNITAVHVDHQLREGSAAEGAVVANAAEQFRASYRSETVTVAEGPDLENRCRSARREVLGAEALTGHTMDDQAETLLINLMRGAGPEGLAAMRPGGTHPILALRRAETHAVCVEFGLSPVTDPTNSDPRFVRNRIRHELLPLMAAISNRDPAPLLARTSDNLRDLTEGLDELAEGVDPTDTRLLALQPAIIQRIVLRKWLTDDNGYRPSAAELARVLDVVHHRAVGTELAGGRVLRRTDGFLRLHQ